ncbi:MAG: hypothetical protein RL758_269 [Pseudomonadota bacterium]|jgi:hypothetical protein
MRYAQIQNGTVSNVIESAADPGAPWVACGNAGPGSAYDGANFTAPAQVNSRHITKLAFRQRFTKAERTAIEIASLDDPAATLFARQQAAFIRASQEDLRVANYIDLDRTDTRAGVISMEAAGLLAAGRALQILDAPIQPAERG